MRKEIAGGLFGGGRAFALSKIIFYVFSFTDTNMIQLPGKVIVGIFGLNKGRVRMYYR